MKLAKITVLTSLIMSSATQAELTNEINFQGFSGLFNVPTGETIDYGDFHFNYNNLVDSQLGRFGDIGTEYTDGKAVSFHLSPFPGLEVGLRNIDSDLKGFFTPDGRVRLNEDNSDLSANIKYSPTFIPKDWFSLAIGVQDIGGIASNLDAQFLSISKEWGDFRFTVGTGNNEDAAALGSAPRYDGGFWGVEYQPFDWLKVLAEDDGADQTFGIRLATPEAWLGNTAQIYGTVVAKDSYLDSDDNVYFGVGIRTSLFSSVNTGFAQKSEATQKIADAFDWLFNDGDYAEYQPLDIGLSSYKHTSDKLIGQLGLIKNRIEKQGFERLWLGYEEGTLFLRFENSVFNRNDIDAIGVVLGILAGMAVESVQTLDITLSKYGVPVLRFDSDLEQVQQFYRGERQTFAINSQPVEHQKVSDMLWIGGSDSPYWVPRIEFSPVIRNFVGTELGAYDYSVSLRTSLTLPLWEGGEFLIDYDTHLFETDSFDRGRSFYRWRRDDGVHNLFLRQTLALPFNIYGSFAIGRAKEMLFEEHDVFASELEWQSPSGAHKVGVYGAILDNVDFDVLDREIYTAHYRYYLESLNMSLEVEGGQFWRQDRGIKLTSKFHFGDTKVSVFLQDTDVSLFGIQVSLPLTPRRDMRPSFIQIKGDDNWSHSLSTKINGDENLLSPQRAYRPKYLRHLDRVYTNNDRLSISYFRANLSRLRNAYQRFTR